MTGSHDMMADMSDDAPEVETPPKPVIDRTSPTEVVVSWDWPPLPPAGWELRCRRIAKRAGKWHLHPVSAGCVSVGVSDLEPDTPHEFQVRPAGDGEWSTSALASTQRHETGV